jgi:hypothetical protein
VWIEAAGKMAAALAFKSVNAQMHFKLGVWN